MKKYLLILVSFMLFKAYSQSKKTTYFYVNPKDSLIEKQIATKSNEFEGYRVINENKIVRDTRRSDELGGDDIEYDTFECFYFSFNRKNDTIISKSHLNTLSFIKDRRQFIETLNQHLMNAWIEYIFIEPIKCNKFILRKVEISTFE